MAGGRGKGMGVSMQNKVSVNTKSNKKIPNSIMLGTEKGEKKVNWCGKHTPLT